MNRKDDEKERKSYADRIFEVTTSATSATLISKSLLHPLDTIKCRMQAFRSSASSATSSASSTSAAPLLKDRWKGQWRVQDYYRGLGVKLTAYIPMQSIYMNTFEGAKTFFQEQQRQQQQQQQPIMMLQPVLQHHLFPVILASICADMACAVIRVPLEVSKIRLQSSVYQHTPFFHRASPSPPTNSNSGSACGEKTSQNKKGLSLFQYQLREVQQQSGGGPATKSPAPPAASSLFTAAIKNYCSLARCQLFFHDIPYSLVQWMCYETIKPWLKETITPYFVATASKLDDKGSCQDSSSSDDKRLSGIPLALCSLLSGGISGSTAALITTPLDVCRTRIIVESSAFYKNQSTAASAAATSSSASGSSGAGSGPHSSPSSVPSQHGVPSTGDRYSVRRMFGIIYRENGVRCGLFRGAGMRVLWVGSNMALYFTLYEYFKTLHRS